MSKSRLVSGRIKKVTGAELSTDRHEYLDLANAEPDLGLPSVDQSVLIGDVDGTRTWVDITTYAEDFKGYAGSQGDIGYTGSFGFTGSQGDVGYTGSQGDIGYTGSQGDIGFTGSQGDIGYTGSRGADGQFGGASFYYIFESDSYVDTVPDGYFRLDNNDTTLVTFIALADTDRFGTNIATFIQTVDDSTSDIKGYIKLTAEADPSMFTIFAIMGEHTTHDDHFHIPLSYVSGQTAVPLDDTNAIISFTVNGDRGDTGFVGSQGDIGYTGSQGDIGYTGSQGDIGYTGSQGEPGDTGFVGSQGDQGNTGYTGSQGDQGNTGYTGSQGDQGYDGSRGFQGFTGSQGDTGFTGSQGDTGFVGSTGDLGYTGSRGNNGYTGSQGYTGSRGDAGLPGGDGYTGSEGYTGSQGDIGYTGSQGDTGFVGSQGLIGLEPWQLITDDHAASDKERLIVQSSDNNLVITLPSSPTAGNYIQITDGASFAEFPITINRNGNTIEGISDNVTLDLPASTFEFIYDGSTWHVTSTTGPQGYTGSYGYTGSAGLDGYTGSAGPAGTSVQIVSTVPTSEDLPDPYEGSAGDGYIVQTNGYLWIWDGAEWFEAGQITGYTGSQGELGYTGSSGNIGYTGSQGDIGYTGSAGFAGSNGADGPTGYTGSIGYTGSQGIPGEAAAIGYTGSGGDAGYTGSEGYAGSRGYTGSQGEIGFTGSQGVPGEFAGLGYTGSQGGFDSQQELSISSDITYTLSSTDIGKLIVLDNANQIDLIIPDGETLAVEIGQRFDLMQYNNGPVLVSGAEGVSVYSPFSASLNEQYAIASVIKIGVDEWIFVGPQAAGYTGSFGYTGSEGVGFTGSSGRDGYTGSIGGFDSQQEILTFTGSTYQLSNDNLGKIVELSNIGSALITVTIPTDTVLFGISVGQRIDILQGSSSAIEIVADEGVTLNAPATPVFLNKLYMAITLIKIGENEWTFIGGSRGELGYTGSQGIPGEAAAIGYTGSQASPALVPNEQTSSYTLVSTDIGKYISITSGGVTVPSGEFVEGDIVSIYNNSSSTQTITQGSGVTMYLVGTSLTGDRSITEHGLVTILCVGTDEFVITGGGLI